MKIKSIVPVTHVDVAKVATGGTKQGIIEMHIGQMIYIDRTDGQQIVEAQYQYIDADKNVLPTANRNKLTLQGDIDAISATLGNNAASFSEHFRKDVKAYAINEMATLFNIQASEIEEIVE